MNTIKIYLKDSGSIAELYKDFRLYAGSYQDKSIKIYVPKSMVYQSGELNTMLTTVKVGAILTNEKGQKITTKSYAVVYIAEELVNGVDYLVYERKLPKEFCAIAGNQTVVINVENMLNESEQKTVLSIITSQTAVLEVLDSANLDKNEVVEPTELDLVNAQINDIYQAIGLGEINYGDVINRVETLENNSVTLNTEQTITATKTIDLPMNVGNGYRGLVFKKGSGGGTVPVAIEFVDSNNNSIALVSPASDGVYFSGNITFTHNLNNFSIDEVPTKIEMSVDPSNYVLTTNLKNNSNTVLSTATVDLPLESMVVNGTYDSETKEVVLTLQNGNEVRFSVADLVSGLVSQTDFDNIVNNTTKIENSSGGFAGGENALASYGGAVGGNARATNGGAVGGGAYATNGGAVGNGARTDSGGAIGENATSTTGGAVGYGAKTSGGFAGGNQAKAIDSSNNGIDAIQLGTGTNSNPKTLQVYDDNIYNANTHTLTVTGGITDGTNSITIANTPQLDTANTFTKSNEFIMDMSSDAGIPIVISIPNTGGYLNPYIRFKYHNDDIGDISMDSVPLGSGLIQSMRIVGRKGMIIGAGESSIGFISDTITNVFSVVPGALGYDYNRKLDLGSADRQWKDIYLSGNLTDGTNSITIGEIVNNIGGVSAVLGNTEDLGV